MEVGALTLRKCHVDNESCPLNSTNFASALSLSRDGINYKAFRGIKSHVYSFSYFQILYRVGWIDCQFPVANHLVEIIHTN